MFGFGSLEKWCKGFGAGFQLLTLPVWWSGRAGRSATASRSTLIWLWTLFAACQFSHAWSFPAASSSWVHRFIYYPRGSSSRERSGITAISASFLNVSIQVYLVSFANHWHTSSDREAFRKNIENYIAEFRRLNPGNPEGYQTLPLDKLPYDVLHALAQGHGFYLSTKFPIEALLQQKLMNFVENLNKQDKMLKSESIGRLKKSILVTDWYSKLAI